MAKGIPPHSDDRADSVHQHQPQSSARITPSAPPYHPDDEHHLALSAQLSPNSVSFLVNANETVAGNRMAIISSSTELARIISETQPMNGHYKLHELIDRDDFEAIVMFFESKYLKLNDMPDALRKLEFAKRYGCASLLRHCIKEVDNLLTPANVISVFQTVRSFVVSFELFKEALDQLSMDQCMQALLYNVLQFIDQNADVVLQRDEIFDAYLNFNEIESILSRDTLMTTEMVIFNCLGRWSRGQCISRKLEITAENRRRVLGSLSYLPRYLLMPVKEFELACQRFEILDEEESKLISDHFAGRLQMAALSEGQMVMMTNFKKSRPKFARMPIHLSGRSHPKNYSSKMRKAERKIEGESTCSRWFYWTCRCWSIVYKEQANHRLLDEETRRFWLTK